MEDLRCLSCGAFIALGEGAVKLSCPQCSEVNGRCARCRNLGKRYLCTCGFVGP